MKHPTIVILLHGSSGIHQNAYKWANFLKVLGPVIIPSFNGFSKKYNLCNSMKINSNVKDIKSNKRDFDKMYKLKLYCRQLHLDYVLSSIPKNYNIILAGISEGAILTSMATDKRIIQKWILSYPCTKNYFTRNTSKILPKSMKNVPTIFINGTFDQYFGKNGIAGKLGTKQFSPDHLIKKRNYTHSLSLKVNTNHDVSKVIK